MFPTVFFLTSKFYFLCLVIIIAGFSLPWCQSSKQKKLGSRACITWKGTVLKRLWSVEEKYCIKKIPTKWKNPAAGQAKHVELPTVSQAETMAYLLYRWICHVYNTLAWTKKLSAAVVISICIVSKENKLPRSHSLRISVQSAQILTNPFTSLHEKRWFYKHKLT